MIVCLAATLSSLSFAQESDLLESENSSGRVVEISDSQITVSQYDYESEDMVAVSYVITENTVIKNATLQDITKGSDVEIIYTVEVGKKVAKSITVKNQEVSAE